MSLKLRFLNQQNTKIWKTESISYLTAGFDAEFTGCKFCPVHKENENKIFPGQSSESHSRTGLGKNIAAPTKASRNYEINHR